MAYYLRGERAQEKRVLLVQYTCEINDNYGQPLMMSETKKHPLVGREKKPPKFGVISQNYVQFIQNQQFLLLLKPQWKKIKSIKLCDICFSEAT